MKTALVYLAAFVGVIVLMLLFLLIVPPSFACVAIKRKVHYYATRLREELTHINASGEPLA